MFAKATSNFVKEIDPEGRLIPVSRLNDSDKLVPLSLVIRRKRFWFWQRPKYLPSDFTLSDVLLGDKPINPVVVETDFLKYAGTFGDSVSGKVDAEVGQTNLSVEGKGSFKLQSSFGSLKKQEVDVPKLLQDSKDRVLSLEHCLVHQTLVKRNEAFGVLKEKIVTTQKCSVTEDVQEQGQCAGVLGLFSNRAIKVSVNENGSAQQDSSVSLEIPAQTVIAYSIIELEVKHGGQYELCLEPDTFGGFEVDSHTRAKDAVDGLITKGAEYHPARPTETPVLKQELEKLQAHFQQLADLPAPARSTLLQLLMSIMLDRAALAALESGLDQLCLGGTPDLSELEDLSSLKQTVQDLLDLVLQSNQAGQNLSDGQSGGPRPSSPVLTAVHVLVSAMAEMTDAALSHLGSCSPQFLHDLQQLVHCLAAGGEMSLQDPALSELVGQAEAYQRAEQLFSCSKVILQREAGTLRVETGSQISLRPLVMCITVRGLASLGT
ncbi:gasdermin Eb [Anguilla anguilla]|uniref:gasdermin Eb n=1 Tax=Anguilla anguilla TaxID=7936 RepID=UPI0015A7AAE0|nr:gasdermin Eb [Anguilla anguilla]XP_035270351.1 gasdermin Eb [Anguilla anguilla]